MKCFLLLVAVILGVFSTAFAATAIGFHNDPRNPGKCTVEEDLILEPNVAVPYRNGECGKMICRNGGLVEYYTCGAVSAPDGCTVGNYINIQRPYPDCCERNITCSN